MVAVLSIWILLSVAFNIVRWGVQGHEARTCPAYYGRCYTLAEVRAAYGIQPLLDRGIDGRGQTVTVTEYAPEPEEGQEGPFSDIRSDLRTFDAYQRLPPATITVDSPFSTAERFMADSEETLDVEMVHAIAPGATIRVVQVPRYGADVLPRWNGFYLIRMLEAVLDDPHPPDVVSISYAISERCLTARDRAAVHTLLGVIASRDITVLAASGDSGVSEFACGARSDGRYLVTRSVSMPAADPSVTGVGGTSLNLAQPSGQYVDETAWNELPSPTANPAGVSAQSTASGGGFSSSATPTYQSGLTDGHRGRGVPDVAADADEWTGIVTAAVVDGRRTWRNSEGTSASTPLWAGIIALADQYAHRRLGAINPALYQIATNPQDRGAFHPVTSGDNSVQSLSGQSMTGYLARAPWSPVTGLGSPVASRLVPLLAASTAGR